ncbi:MAG: type 4a pilus biogenesis protein PilO [Chitinispirillaceae bacterium]
MHDGFIRKLSKDGVFILIICAAALACCAALRYLAQPQWVEYTGKKEKIKKFDFYISSSEGFDNLKDEIKEKNRQLKRKLENIPSQIPSRSVSGILEELISRAREENILFSRIQPQRETKTETQVRIPVVLQMRTEYHSLGRFIASLETLPQILQVSKLALEVDKTGKLNAKILVTCLIPQEEI